MPEQTLLGTDDLLALLDATKKLNRLKTLDSTLTELLEMATRLADARAGSVLLPDSTGDLRFAATTGPAAPESLRSLRVPVEGSVAGEVFRTGKYKIVDRVKRHYDGVDEATSFVTKSMVCVPLVHREEVRGVMQILNKGDGQARWDERDVELLDRFGQQAALAVGNAELFERLIGTSGLFARSEVREPYLQRVIGPSGEQRTEPEQFAILYVDMRGFTRLCRVFNNRSKQIKGILDEYFEMLVDQVVSRDGIVNKLIGDGLVAVFAGKDRLENAVRAAFAIADTFPILRDRWDRGTRQSLEFVDVGIGLTQDWLFFGQIGGKHCYDVSAIGEGVGFAAALCDHARDGHRVLCDAPFLNAGTWRRRLSWVMSEKLEAFPAKGSEDMVDNYRLYTESENDVFVSYRRTNGAAAHAVRLALQDEYRVFLDVTRLRSGDFEEALMQSVSTCRHFVVLLKREDLERWAEQDDWVRKEIAHALETKRNVVPILWPDFEFPEAEEMPRDIRALRSLNGLRYQHEGFDAMMTELKQRFLST